MTPMQRVLCTLSHQEPDRVPFFLLLTMHGAKQLGMSIEEYFSKPENVIKGQLQLQEKYQHDCLYSFFYAAIDYEAWGGGVIFQQQGPANAAAPIISNANISDLSAPRVAQSGCLDKVLQTISGLKQQVGDSIPIIGVVMSPFSLPVMQMGFDKYIELIYQQADLFQQLMVVNEQFCIEWGNAQLAAGATAICYFDPVSSTTIIPKQLYLETGAKIAKRVLAALNGPTATHMASGRCLSIIDNIAETGTAAVGVSRLDDLTELKKAASGKISLLGNLNGIEMHRWDAQRAEQQVKQSIAQAAAGGGYILSDNHGEIPYQTPDAVLSAISDAVRRWGQYPLNWLDDHGR